MNPPARIAELERQLHWAQLEIQSLREELRQRRIQQLGPKSETLSNLQLELLADQEPSATRDEVEAESKREPLKSAPPRERKQHPGRKPLPDTLPRVTEVIPCTACTCVECGELTTVIGYDESEQLDVEPARYFVRVTKREKRACHRCAAVIAAPLAERIVEKGLASDAVVINTVVAKYCEHLPLYRQAVMLEREAGVEIGRATLDGWVMRVGELLTPVVGAMRRDLLAGSYLQADETPVPVQMQDQRGENHHRWAETGARRLLGARAAQVRRRGESESAGRGGDRDGHVHGRIVSDRSRCTPAEPHRGGTFATTQAIRRRMVARYSRVLPGARHAGAAEERVGTSGDLHIEYVDQASEMF
jgi:transposase